MWLALRGRAWVLVFAVALGLAACATPPQEGPQADVEVVTPVLEEPAAPAQQEPQPVAQETSPAPAEQTGEFRVTEEVYEKTFDELEESIRRWNALIAHGDYDGWLAILSSAFVAERSSPEYLAELSRSQRLRGEGIVLKTLRDYFNSVVVRARVEASLGKIEFVGPTKVKAYAVIDGEPAILYYVVRENGSWKIGTSNEMASDRSLR